MDFDLRLIGTVGGWNFDSEYIDYVLNKKKGSTVNVMIDSLGGYTNTALSVSAAFRNHGDVNVTFRGMNASAATIAALGAKHVAIESDGLYLIHKCSVTVIEWAQMNEEQLAAKIAELEHTRQNSMKIDVAVAKAYANRTGKTQEELLELMSKELWLTAQEALEYGFVDEVINADSKKNTEMVITSSMEDEFKKAGIPLPSMLRHEEEGILSKIAKLFKSNSVMAETNLNPQQPAQQSAAPATPTMEELQKSISDLQAKVTSMESSNKTLTEENDRLKSEIEEMKGKAQDPASSQVLNNGGENEEQDNGFLSNLAEAQKLYNLV